MDCMEVMRLYPDKHFDLAIVDPPYGLKKGSFHGRGKLKDRFINRHAGEVEEWDSAPYGQRPESRDSQGPRQGIGNGRGPPSMLKGK